MSVRLQVLRPIRLETLQSVIDRFEARIWLLRLVQGVLYATQPIVQLLNLVYCVEL